MVLIMLARNAVAEKRFRDASYFYWLLSQISLNLNKSTDEIKALYSQYYEKADVYYAYHEVHKYIVSKKLTTFKQTKFYGVILRKLAYYCNDNNNSCLGRTVHVVDARGSF